MSQLVKAVHFCHSAKIIHRDISPKNILLNQQGNHHLIQDFLNLPISVWPAISPILPSPSPNKSSPFGTEPLNCWKGLLSMDLQLTSGQSAAFLQSLSLERCFSRENQKLTKWTWSLRRWEALLSSPGPTTSKTWKCRMKRSTRMNFFSKCWSKVDFLLKAVTWWRYIFPY